MNVRSSFVLASRSPRRKSLLASAGLNPQIVAADVDETPHPGEAPLAYALRVATDKACAHSHPVPVLAADTVVALDAEILGKPEDDADARRMLTALSGRDHAVHTAVVVRTPSGKMLSEVVSTVVRFRGLSPEEIDSYVATGEPFDKAGAYGIQGGGGALVDAVFGSYTNVVGLPLAEALRLLALGSL